MPSPALAAEALLTALVRELDKPRPSAATSLREGMAETLTVLRLDVPPTLAPKAALDQRDREHDLDLPRHLAQRQALA
jgi:hypothetical protein